MKLLMIYCERFAYTLGHQSLEQIPPCEERGEAHDALIGFIHAEAADERDAGKVETKLVKNLKWGARSVRTDPAAPRGGWVRSRTNPLRLFPQPGSFGAGRIDCPHICRILTF